MLRVNRFFAALAENFANSGNILTRPFLRVISVQNLRDDYASNLIAMLQSNILIAAKSACVRREFLMFFS